MYLASTCNSMVIELYADKFWIHAPYRIRKSDVKLNSIKKGKSSHSDSPSESRYHLETIKI